MEPKAHRPSHPAHRDPLQRLLRETQHEVHKAREALQFSLAARKQLLVRQRDEQTRERRQWFQRSVEEEKKRRRKMLSGAIRARQMVSTPSFDAIISATTQDEGSVFGPDRAVARPAEASQGRRARRHLWLMVAVILGCGGWSTIVLAGPRADAMQVPPIEGLADQAVTRGKLRLTQERLKLATESVQLAREVARQALRKPPSVTPVSPRETAITSSAKAPTARPKTGSLDKKPRTGKRVGTRGLNIRLDYFK